MATLGLILVLGGCNPAEDEETAEKPAPPVSFDGKIEPKLVGVWELKSGGKSTMRLNGDGTSQILSVVKMFKDEQKADIPGIWLVKDSRLVMQRKGPDGKELTLDYDYTLDPAGQSLQLSIPGRKSKQTYQRVGK
ncbi:hypothetical protein EON81_06500 [bacterium]|nr:MAG: hypothetical protein EON81_06500 [bacterium]